jgi:hypothetical protein
VLDVDRVAFGRPNDRHIGDANLARLVRSLRKLRAQARLTVSDEELATLTRLASAEPVEERRA